MKTKLDWIRIHIMDILIWGLTAFFTLLYVSLIFNQNIWTDEAFTLQLVQGNLKEIVEGTANDVHPPLYYFYSKLFYDITGGSLQVQKILAILPQVGTLLLVATVFRKKFGDMAAFLSLAFFTCLPCTMEFAVQVRMYSLSLFFVTLCGIYAYEAYMENTKKSWVWVVVGALGAAYSHYFAFVSIIVIVGFLFLAILFTKRALLKNWVISAACMIVGYLPWAGYFIEQVTRVRESYWIPEITPEVIWSYFTWTLDLVLLPGVVYIFIALLAIATFICIVRLIRNRQKEDMTAILALLIPTVTAVLGVVISMTKSPIYRDQYVFPALMLLSVFFGLAFRKMNWKLMIPVCGFLLLVGAVQFKECYRQEYKSTYIDKTLAFFEENVGENDIILYNMEAMDFIYELYFPDMEMHYIRDFDLSSDFETVWFLNTFNQWPITQLDLINNGLTMDFMGLYGIEHNEFDLYKVYHVGQDEQQ